MKTKFSERLLMSLNFISDFDVHPRVVTFKMKILVLLGVFIFSISALAMSGKTTYQAKIIKPDGYPLEAVNVNFKFSVLDTVGSCVLYSETYSAINMTATSGLISFALGSGARSFPPANATTAVFSNVFDNSIVSMPCEATGIYNPLPNDTRRIVMQFNDGTGWQTLPAMTINAVPYAMYANKSNDAKTLNGKADTAFVETSTLAALSCNAATHAITFNGASFSCIPVGASSSGISSVTTNGSVLSTGGTASAPVISIQAATVSQDGYLTSLDYAEFKAKLSASSTQIINTLGYAPVSSSAVATQINSSNLSGDVSGTVSANSVVSVGGKSAAQISASVDDTLAATSSATADTIVKRNSSGHVTINDLYANATKINYVDIYKPSTSFNIRLQAPTSLSSSYVLNLPTTSGTTGQVLSTDGAGNLSWINAATGSVTTINVNAPLSSTGGATPTISISQATSSTDGYLSSADWNTFNNKQQATSAAIIATLGYTPADNAVSGTYAQKTNNLSDLTNFASARANLGLGTLATASSIDLGSASATGTLSTARLPSFSGDVNSVSGSNLISLNTVGAGVTSGTQYTKVTVDGKGRVTSGAQLSSSDVTTALGYTPSNAASAGITTLNGSSVATQTFATGSAGTSFGISTAGGVHTFNIPFAASSSVTAGLLSNADYSIFMNKQQATSAAIIATLGYTPADNAASGTYLVKASNLSDLANVSQARTNLGLGGFATISSLDLGSTSATGTLAVGRLPSFTGDVNSVSGSNLISLNTVGAGVTSGTQYTKVTVDGKGRVTSGAQLSSSDVTTALGYTPATSTTLAASFVQKTGDTMTGALNLPSNGLAVGTNQLVVSGSFVGIGTSNPSRQLHLSNALPKMLIEDDDGPSGVGRLETEVSDNVATFRSLNSSLAIHKTIMTMDLNTGNISMPNAVFNISAVNGKTTYGGNWRVGDNTNNFVIQDTQSSQNTFEIEKNGVAASLYIKNNGNVGVGLLAPTAKLHLVSGTVSANTAPLKFTSGTLTSTAEAGAMEYDGFNFYLTDSTPTRRMIATGSSAGTIDNAQTINSSSNISLVPNSSVIVSSTTASTSSNNGALVVKGGLGVAGSINTAGNLNVSGSSVIDGSLKLSTMTSGSVLFAGVNGTVTQDNSSLFWDGANKRLGIGSNSPAQTLSVSGASYFSGNVGIGTTSPSDKVEILGSTWLGQVISVYDSGGGFPYLNLRRGGGTPSAPSYPAVGQTLGGVHWQSNGDNTSAYIQAQTTEVHSSTARGAKIRIANVQNGTTTLVERMTILDNGNIGIGTTSPNAKLQVSGSAVISSDGAAGAVGALRVKRLSTDSDNIISQFYYNDAGGTNPRVDILGSANKISFKTSYTTGGADLEFGTNTVSQAMTVKETGNVGIGTTVPTALLDVSKSGTSDPIAKFSSPNPTDSVALSIGHGTSFSSLAVAGGANAFTPGSLIDDLIIRYPSGKKVLFSNGGLRTDMVVDGGGNVGIGTTTPGEKLDVAGNMRVGNSESNYIAFRGTTGDGAGSYNHTYIGERFYAAGESSELLLFKGNDSDNTSGPDRIRMAGGNILFDTYNTPDAPSGAFESVATSPMITTKMIIKGNGNVGIGTSAPNAKLEVAGGIAATFNSNLPHFIAGSTGSGVSDYNYILQGNNDTGTKAVHFVNSSVRTTDGAANSYTIRNDGGILRLGHLSFQTQLEGSSFYFNSGSVGIGTNTPSQALHIAGDRKAIFGPNSSWGANLIVGGNGWVGPDATVVATDGNLHLESRSGGYSTYVNWYAATGGLRVGNGTGGGYGPVLASAFTVSSDERLKKDIKILESASDKISQIRGVSYNYKDKKFNQEVQIGVIAQEVQKVYPEAVLKDEKGFLSVNYAILVAPLIQAFKELKSQVEEFIEGANQQSREIASLKQENAQLKREMEEQKRKNDEIKAYLCEQNPKGSICSQN